MFKAHHPLNSKQPDCFQPEDWCTEYLHPMREYTTGQPHYTEADATALFCQNSQVLVGRQLPMYNYWPPTRTDNSTRLFVGDCHGHNDIYMDMARHHDRYYQCGYSDSLYELVSLGPTPMAIDCPVPALEDLLDSE